MSGRRRALAAILGLVLGIAGPWVRRADADAVDDAFAEGHAAAAEGRWPAAVKAYERAADLLPGESDVLQYDLGTAYAHVDQLGPATFHLRRAQRLTSDPALREAARRNLGVVRRRAELAAATEQARLSAPPDWRDRLWLALAAPLVGLVGIVLGWGAVALAALRVWWRRRAFADRFESLPLAIALAVGFAVVSILHGLALRSDPEAIALDPTLEVREGPGRHRAVAFVLQGGASVRVVGDAPGWAEIRLDGGLRGWVQTSSLGVLDRERTPLRESSVAPVSAQTFEPAGP